MHVARNALPPLDESEPVSRARLSWREGVEFKLLEELAGMVALGGRSLRALVTPPFIWRREFVVQCSLATRRCVLPVALASAAFILGAGIIITGPILELVGAEDRLGFGIAVASLREFSTWITGMIVAGVAGTAISADLGARRVREEIDAIEALAVDPYRALVLPRLLAFTAMMPALYIWSALWAAAVPVVAGPSLIGFPVAQYLESYGNLLTIDVWAGLVRMTLIGFVGGLVFCYKGFNSSGGTEGVGRSVNQAVVVAFVAIWVVSLLFNAIFLGTFPDAQNLR